MKKLKHGIMRGMQLSTERLIKDIAAECHFSITRKTVNGYAEQLMKTRFANGQKAKMLSPRRDSYVDQGVTVFLIKKSARKSNGSKYLQMVSSDYSFEHLDKVTYLGSLFHDLQFSHLRVSLGRFCAFRAPEYEFGQVRPKHR